MWGKHRNSRSCSSKTDDIGYSLTSDSEVDLRVWGHFWIATWSGPRTYRDIETRSISAWSRFNGQTLSINHSQNFYWIILIFFIITFRIIIYLKLMLGFLQNIMGDLYYWFHWSFINMFDSKQSKCAKSFGQINRFWATKINIMPIKSII